MKHFRCASVFSAILFLCLAVNGTAMARGGGGGGHGGGGHGGGSHGGHGHGSFHGRVSFGVGFGFCCGPWYPYYGYGWPYYPAYAAPYYADAPAYFYSAADAYPSAQYAMPAQQ